MVSYDLPYRRPPADQTPQPPLNSGSELSPKNYKCASTALGISPHFQREDLTSRSRHPQTQILETPRLPGRPAPGSSAGSARTPKHRSAPELRPGARAITQPSTARAPRPRGSPAGRRSGLRDPALRRPQAAGATRSARWATTHAEAPRRASRPGRPRPGPSLTQSSVPQLMVQGPGRGPRPPSPAIAEPLRTLRMRKARRPPFPLARASSSLGSPPLVSSRGAKWPEEAAAATAAARPPRTGAEGRGGAGRKAGRGGVGLTARLYRPAPRLP